MSEYRCQRCKDTGIVTRDEYESQQHKRADGERVMVPGLKTTAEPCECGQLTAEAFTAALTSLRNGGYIVVPANVDIEVMQPAEGA